MKKFDKGYIFSSILSDLFGSLVIVFFFLGDALMDGEARLEDVIGAIPLFAAVFAAVFFCFLVYRILYYNNSGYELTEKEIICKKGVLFRKRSVLDYKNVHAINKRQNLIHRIFGIAVLTVDSGSTNTAYQAEITIVEKAKIVDALLEELNALKQSGVRSVNAGEEVLLSQQDSLYRFTSKKKMLYTFINIVSTAFFTALTGVLTIITISVCQLLLRAEDFGTWGGFFLIAGLTTVGAMLLLSFFSFVGCLIYAFVGYHKFSVTKRGSDIQIAYGLLERHTNAFSYDRIKAVKITQGPIQRLLGFAAIRLEVIGYTVDTGDDNNAGVGVLVPFCKYKEVGQILGRILPDFVPDEKQTKAAAYFPFVSWFSLIVGVVTGLVLLLTVATMKLFALPAIAITAVAWGVAGAGALVLAGKAVHAAFSYKTNGLALGNGKMTVYSGGFSKKVTVFRSKNLIAVEDVTTPMRKKAGITSLVMHLKTNALSNEIKVHIQNEALSEEMEKMLVL